MEEFFFAHPEHGDGNLFHFYFMEQMRICRTVVPWRAAHLLIQLQRSLCLGTGTRRQVPLLGLQKAVLSEQAGPQVEPIPYPGYSQDTRNKMQRAVKLSEGSLPGGRAGGRGSRGQGGHGSGASVGAADPLAACLPRGGRGRSGLAESADSLALLLAAVSSTTFILQRLCASATCTIRARHSGNMRWRGIQA